MWPRRVSHNWPRNTRQPDATRKRKRRSRGKLPPHRGFMDFWAKGPSIFCPVVGYLSIPPWRVESKIPKNCEARIAGCAVSAANLRRNRVMYGPYDSGGEDV